VSHRIKRRLKVSGTLVCASPVHVGGLEGASSTDLSLSVNGAGQLYVPGTSLAGTLRDWCMAVHPIEEVEDLFGPEQQKGSDGGHASFLIVEDATIVGLVAKEIREGVGIDRISGTAAVGIKFSREILPAGTHLLLRLVQEESTDPSRFNHPWILADLLRALQRGKVRLGAAKSRGLGKVQLKDLRTEVQDFTSKASVLDVLRGTAKTAVSDDLKVHFPTWQPLARERPSLKVSIDWQPVGPLMVQSSVEGMVIDTLPLVSRNNADLKLVLPGSSIKGAMRAHAERICATLFEPSHRRANLKFNEQLDLHQLALTLFGARNASVDEKDDNPSATFLGLSALSVEDCFSCQSIPDAVWTQLTSNAPTDKSDEKDPAKWLHQNLDPSFKKTIGAVPYLDPAMHVAIDRWTGGAADGLLFSVLEPWNFKWEPIDLTIDPLRLAARRDQTTDAGENALATIALLIHTLRDLAAGEIPLGFGVNRGMGSIAVTSVKITANGPSAATKNASPWFTELATTDPLEIAGADFSAIFEWLKPIERAWAAYLAKHEVRAVKAS
jgi:CRISPR/Cas system CSM-associated protein Csm3 (group 7 of RAMP superfamily)